MAEARKKPDVEREFANERIVVTWEPRLCIHVGECYRGLPEVFRPKERPWVRVDEADADAIAKVIEACPTGALGYRRLDGAPREAAPEETEVRPDPEGPLYLRGRVRVHASDGTLLRETTRVALCRCGHSGNKPFCDGTHLKVGFREDGDGPSQP